MSSTFRDMQAERDHLVRFVFPKLRQELLQRRIHLVDVDLRWGVTSEQDALSVCREIVDECRPRFLCVLGGRYGWMPPGKTRSITADEVHYGVLDRDLKSRGFAYFYFRDPAATAAMVEVAPGEFREPTGSHGAVALAELKTAIVEAGLQPFVYRAHWDDQSRLLIGLKEFGDRVYADLKQSIGQEFGPATGEKPDEFIEENAAMEAFIEERVQRFVLGSRQPVWNELRQHAESTGGNGYLCLTGEAGSGKSALLGKFCQDYRESHPQDLMIPHFVGASPGSTDVRRTLRRLCHELVTGAALTVEIPEDPEKLRVAFAEILQQASAKKRVVILLDAINQFDSTTQMAVWSWLPEELPATVCIILSSLNGPSLDSLRQRRQPPRLLELQPLDVPDREAIIREFLHRYRKSMTDDQRAALLAKADADTPLYLLVALEELRTLGTYEEITNRIAQLPPDTRALFTWILKRLEDDDGFRDASGRKIGRELVSRFVSLLGASRHGLSQQELVELLSPGDPKGNVAALAQLLRPYLMRRGELLDFYHGQFREAVATSYLQSESERLTAHDQLATYFRDKADPEKNQSWKGDKPRPLVEVVFHLVEAQRVDDSCRTLCDLRFVEARCRYVQVFELIADYRLAQEHLPEAQADLLEERAQGKRVWRWTAEIIEYARQWSDRRDRLARGETVTEPEPQSPESVPSCEMWSDERIQAECDRIIHTPTRRDRLEAFARFVSGQCYPLLDHGQRHDFVLQHAFNTEPAGAVHDATCQLVATLPEPHLLRHWPPGTIPNPKPALLRTLEGHVTVAYSVSITPDGRRAISSGLDKTLRVWNLDTGQCVWTLKGHTDRVECVTMTPDGRLAVSGGGTKIASHGVFDVPDNTLRVWDLESWQCLHMMEGHTDCVRSLSVTPDGQLAVSGSEDQTLRVWNLQSGQCLKVLRGHSDSVESVCITPDGQLAVSGSTDKTLRIWDMATGRCLGTLLGHKAGVGSIWLTDDRRFLGSASWDKTLRIWSLQDMQCKRVIEHHGERFQSVSTTGDGRIIVSACRDNTLRVWDLEKGQCRRTISGHSAAVHGVSMTPDGRRAVSSSWDDTVKLWDLEKGQCKITREGHCGKVGSISVAHNIRCAVTVSSDRILRVWRLGSGECLNTLASDSILGWSVGVTPDCRRAISGSGDATLRVWDLESKQCLHVLKGHVDLVWQVAVTPNGRHAVSASKDKTLRVWNLESGLCLRILAGHTDRVWGVSIAQDGRCAVSSCDDQTLRIWDLENGKCLRVIDCRESGGRHTLFYGLAVTEDGRIAITGSWDKNLQVWDLERGICIRTLEGHHALVPCVSVTPNGQIALSGSYDKTLRVWNVESGQCRGVYHGSAPFSSVALHGDGNLICASTEAGELLFLE